MFVVYYQYVGKAMWDDVVLGRLLFDFRSVEKKRGVKMKEYRESE